MKKSFLKSTELNNAHGLLKAISNKRRLAILCLLIENELTVSDLVKKLEISQSALSQHLQILRNSKIVSVRQEGKFAYYFLSSPEAKSLIKLLHRMYCAN